MTVSNRFDPYQFLAMFPYAKKHAAMFPSAKNAVDMFPVTNWGSVADVCVWESTTRATRYKETYRSPYAGIQNDEPL